MPMQRILARADFAQIKTRARELLNAYRAGAPAAAASFAEFHHKPPRPADAKLSDAQLVLARTHDFPSWPRFRLGVKMFNAIASDDSGAVLELVQTHPHLLFERVNGATSNWGPPLACAVQVGSAKVADALMTAPGQDLQWALDRAILKGRTALARKLIANGAQPLPGVVMGPCESLNVEGLRFLAGIGAPLTDEHGDALAPVGMLLEGYFRAPEAKHACLAFFAAQGVSMPDTPAMAFHRGRIDLLEAHLKLDPGLPHRRFSYREIYPLEAGCHADETLGLHGAPLDGATLLHMSVDFDEIEIARWLLANGADPNMRARVDTDGFGGHTPLFNTVVSQAFRSRRQRDGAMVRLLLDHGADPNMRASIRKGIRFLEDESVHEYRDVTPLALGRAFHARDWVSGPAMALIGARGGA